MIIDANEDLIRRTVDAKTRNSSRDAFCRLIRCVAKRENFVSKLKPGILNVQAT
jgi:hypothetical protein